MAASVPLFDPDVPRLYAPQTVVSLVPSVTESLFDLGIGERVIGITDYCTRPEDKVRHLTRVGGTKNPDVAKIIGLQPHLVIANQEENRREDVEALQDAGIPVWVTFPKTVSDVFNLLWTIMAVFEQPELSERVRHIERTYDWVWSSTKAKEADGTMPSVFAPIWLDPLMTFNGDTYCSDILYVCGARNVFAGRERLYPLKADLGQAEPYPEDDPRVEGRDIRYPRVTWEEVEAAQPDIILLPSEPYEFTERYLDRFDKLDVPAAKHGRIRLVDGALLEWHGTRIAYALQELPALLEITS